ncbi:pyridoxal phosphate-dependent aminotransferase [Nonlabens xiamenensis]|uniref:pyridoxal phosphate-dependent aminotransferase n=1 Tax=Nonlabens xiamenensis TaxID=2341043 RepID=UPI000F606D06|nr:aminotransferase class I/II-fold pyridoxal phosphate-dependent enzyme [Nonlabens xiamenensis]
MIKTAHRLNSVQEYYFSAKLREVKAMIDQGLPVINAGIGNPDLLPPPQVVPALTKALGDNKAHGYQSYLGLPELREAISTFYKRHYGVKLNPVSDIMPLMGSKEGILHISMAFLNPGDAVLLPNPGYPTYTSATELCEATAIPYALTAENNWLPDLDELEQMDLSNVKIMWVNYPHMPTGAPATNELFSKLIDFGKKHQILIVNDNPYSCVGYPDKHSIHQVKGSMEIALELNSVSKTFNMAGWRVGMLSGNPVFLKEILKVKTNMDSGMFYAIQKGAIAALETDPSWMLRQDEIYASRRRKMIEVAGKLDVKVLEQQGGLFVWCALNNDLDDKKFVDRLLHEHHIFIAPGSIFGSNGRGYVRFSLCIDEESIDEINQRLKKTVEI